MSYETIRYEVSESIATITLDRPSVMNAFNHAMLRELHAALDAAEADDGVRAIIFTGQGKAYCAGADLSSGSSTFDYNSRLKERGVEGDGVNWNDPGIRDTGGRLTLRLFQCIKPLICASNGVAVGIGITMQLPMDIRIAADTARFGFVFARRGIVPEAASSWFLPRLVGVSRALDWCYSGRIFNAEEALRAGLVSELLPGDRLLQRAREIASTYIAETAPVSVALIRQQMWRGLTMSHPMEAHRVDSRLVYARGQSADAREGVSAFLQKRKAEFPCTPSRDMPAACFPWWCEPGY